MSDYDDLLAALEAVTNALEQRGIKYFITGSVASSFHGEFRATNDIDIVAEIDYGDVRPLIDSLSGKFIADADQAREAVSTRGSFNLIHHGTYLKVDIFVPHTAFDREAALRAESTSLGGSSARFFVATKEDILLSKLRWYRLGDEASERQRTDIRGLIRLNRTTVDWPYLRKWSISLGVSDLLSRFADEVVEPGAT